MFRSLPFLLACLLIGGASFAAAPLSISQKGRVFTPGEITIPVGTPVEIKNDDRVLHHLYIEHPDFSFDSGEQPPGRDVTIKFDKDGTFAVRCDIHPKMLLTINVR